MDKLFKISLAMIVIGAILRIDTEILDRIFRYFEWETSLSHAMKIVASLLLFAGLTLLLVFQFNRDRKTNTEEK